MKVRKAQRSRKVTMELDATDDALLEKSAAAGTAGAIQLKTILVPVDFSACGRKATEYALAFAVQFRASIMLLHVVEPMVYPENYVAVPAATDEINQSLLTSAQQRLASQKEELVQNGVQVQTMTRLGRPYLEIAAVAKELPADLIILATHGYTGLKHVFLGSTAERVVRHAPCPVLTVRSAEHDFIASA